MYQFDKLADRSQDFSRKWDRKFVEEKFGTLPDEYISMWIADMDFEMAPVIEEALHSVIQKKALGYIYAYDPFLEAIQYWTKAKIGIEPEKEHILLDYSVAMSLYHVVQAFCQPGDCVMIQNPVYGPFKGAAEDNKIEVIENELIIDDNFRYQMDFKQMEAQMIDKNPKLFILCSPHNPGGRIWSKDELTQLAQLCLRHQVILVSDEVHSDHIRCGNFTSCLQLESKFTNNLILFSSPNKGFNMAGLKTSYAIIPNLELRKNFEKVLVAGHLLEPNIFGAAALTAAYTPQGSEWLKESYHYLVGNYQWIEGFCSENLPAYRFMEMESSYLLWMDIRTSGLSSEEFVSRLAKEAGVIFQAGSDFGSAGEGFVRINIGTSLANVQDAFKRLAKWINLL